MKNPTPLLLLLKASIRPCVISASFLIAIAASTAQSENSITQSDRLADPAKDALDLLRDGSDLPQADYSVLASAKNGVWEFQFQSGDFPLNGGSTPLENVPPLPDLFLPQGADAVLTITAQDAIYPFIVSDLNIRTDAIPGRLVTVKVDTSQAGLFHSTCDASCGDRKKSLSFAVHILKPDEFAASVLSHPDTQHPGK